jgi:hypothetical protein
LLPEDRLAELMADLFGVRLVAATIASRTEPPAECNKTKRSNCRGCCPTRYIVLMLTAPPPWRWASRRATQQQNVRTFACPPLGKSAEQKRWLDTGVNVLGVRVSYA